MVSVVDDDESVRESLPDLLRELGFDAQTFASAEDFLGSPARDNTRCLLLDITMPGMSGPELQRELVRQGWSIPVVFITANPEENLAPQLRDAGAVDCLIKPFSEADLVGALTAAIGSS
jgi:FixJ family two-component response regulator